MKCKAILIQNYLSPYRVPLFTSIAASLSIELIVALMAPKKPSYPTWKHDFDSLPFRTVLVPGIKIVLPSERKAQICINPSLIKLLYKEKPDILFCCGFTTSTLFACFYRLLTGTPIVIWSEGTKITEAKRRYPTARTFIRKCISLLASGFIVAGQESQDYIRSLLPEHCLRPIEISYNCVDSEALASACRRFKEDTTSWAKIRSAYPEKNILFSGRLIKLKGIHLMLEVYKKVLEKSSQDVGLILLGEGKLRDFIQDEKNKNRLKHLYIEGFVGPDQYPKYFAIADVFLLLSLMDCNPLVIFEALACGLPVVCSNRVGNAVDFVEEGRNGHIVNPFDIEKIGQKILSVLFSEKIEEMREFSRKIVKKANYHDSAEVFISISKKIFAQRKRTG